MDASYLASKFSSAMPYDQYLQTGTDEQRRRWTEFYNLVNLTSAQKLLLSGFQRNMKVLVVSGIWCGDCVQQCPLFQRIAEASSQIELRLLDRDAHSDLSDRIKICAGKRVPVVLFMAEDFELCGIYGDRSVNRYRAMAARQLAAACPTGLVPPGQDEVSATLQDWVNEFERIQLMLRLSGRLRHKHGD
jgi:thiol-disulfide isomerase/thioredoxin